MKTVSASLGFFRHEREPQANCQLEWERRRGVGHDVQVDFDDFSVEAR
ncbi:hypothetical protein [Pendulispora albinea]|uniref:Uncharacterized protein n=1 Tax=Pendulispora albinea TaxID=2741071 RepID=A0ABZ2M6U7_9BACT